MSYCDERPATSITASEMLSPLDAAQTNLTNLQPPPPAAANGPRSQPSRPRNQHPRPGPPEPSNEPRPGSHLPPAPLSHRRSHTQLQDAADRPQT